MSVGKTTIMIRHTQNIEDCEHCGKVFENGEDYWKDARNKCYCVDNACGWEDDETSDEELHIGSVGGNEVELCATCQSPLQDNGLAKRWLNRNFD